MREREQHGSVPPGTRQTERERERDKTTVVMWITVDRHVAAAHSAHGYRTAGETHVTVWRRRGTAFVYTFFCQITKTQSLKTDQASPVHCFRAVSLKQPPVQ